MNLIQSNKWLVPSFAFSMVLLVLRMLYTLEVTFVFLVWNLFLAIIPLYASVKLESATDKMSKGFYACVWLLFFPNAMYIVTDLFHLRERPEVPLWYDLLLLLSAALNGVIIGFHSLFKVEKWMSTFINKKYLPIIIFALLFLYGYGIYLGRYERWNSWDIVSHPHLLFKNIWGHLVHPFSNRDIWGLSTAFAVWLYFLYKYIPEIAVNRSAK